MQLQAAPPLSGASSPQQEKTAVIRPLRPRPIREMDTDKEALNSREPARDILDAVEGVALALGRRLKFEYQKDADIYQIQVVDMDSGQVIRKIPADEMLKLIENMQKLLGMLLDTHA